MWEFEVQDEPKFLHIVGDSDWVGNVKDRKSTSGGGVDVGGALHQNLVCISGSICFE